MTIGAARRPAPARAWDHFALGRLKPGVMNKSEAAYAAHLDECLRQGSIRWWKFEGMKFRFADNTFYTPDFNVMLASDELECHEVKGFWMDDAKVKIKLAASLYPIRFFAMRSLPKRDGGGWKREEF